MSKEYPNWRKKPKSLTERGYRKYMSKQKDVTVNGQQFKLQSVSPTWYYNLNDDCGNTGGGKRNSSKYMDELFRNCVIAPAEVTAGGMKYFDNNDDIKTAEGLVKEIETFLRS